MVKKMGLFDSWRRKKQPKPRPQIKAREIMTTEHEPSVHPVLLENMAPEAQVEILNLVADYERLFKRREELQVERSTLTERLDKGELTASKFRHELMARIQEASEVSDQLKDISAKLIAHGYRGVLH
jgi:septal ring factor EnvC (AmiA/AmiB activator)